MAYKKLYTVIGFENSPSRKTPVNAENLNKMDSAINEMDERIVEMSKDMDTYATKTEAKKVTQSVSDTDQYRALLLGDTQSETASGLSKDVDGISRITPKIYARCSDGSLLANYLYGMLKGNALPVTNLLATIAGKPLDATIGKKLSDMIEEVVNSLAWKYVGTTTGSVELALPDEWKELRLCLLNSNGAVYATTEILQEILQSSNGVFLLGGGSANSSGTSFFRGRIKVTDSTANIISAYTGTIETPADVLSTTSMHVWYR